MSDNRGESGESPKVTFVLFAYNQERFIRDAVAAAFAQTHLPLEIVLSDDCSTDGTYKLMREMAESYRGPHLVRTVQNPVNVGIFASVIARGKEAKGDIVVVAAADDISLPDRTSRTVAAFEGDVACVSTAVSIIAEDGHTIAQSAERPLHLKSPRIFVRNSARTDVVIQGCSAAYRKWVFDLPINAEGKRYPEDLFFTFYLRLIGARITRLDTPLVLYRSHPASASNYIDPDPIENEKWIRRYDLETVEMFRDFELLADALTKSDQLDRKGLEAMQLTATDRLEWPDLSFTQRLKRTLPAASTGEWSLDLRRFIWKTARLWGSYPRYQPKLFLSRFQKQYRKSWRSQRGLPTSS